jgi:hypothetical protein
MVVAELVFEGAVARLPGVLAETMLRGIDEPGVRIGATSYESELAMCPVAAAVRYAETHHEGEGEWDPAWGTKVEFRARVIDFVNQFDAFALAVGLDRALQILRASLVKRSAGPDVS